MGQEHNEIHYGLAALGGLAKAVGLGDEEGVSRLGETLQPVIDIYGSEEWDYLRQQRRAAAYITVAGGGAGVFTQVTLVNPAGSNALIIARIEGASSVAGTEITANLAAAATFTLANAGTPQAIDTRWGLDASGTATIGQIWWNNALVARVGNAEVWRAVSVAAYDLHGPGYPFILAPNSGVALSIVQANSGILANFSWTERQLLPRELRRP